MNKKSSLSLIICLLLIFGVGIISAADLNLKITGEVNNLSADVWLKTNAASTNSEDIYDLQAPSNPGDIATLSSGISGTSFAIDSYSTNPRVFNLTYSAPSAQTGTLTFSWDSSAITSSLVGTFENYGTDNTYTEQVGSDVNMGSTSSYTTSITGDQNIYIRVTIADYTAPAPTGGDTGGSSSGGGGGGAAAPVVKQPDINIVLNNTGVLLFDAGVVITDKFKSIGLGDKMESTINLIPMGSDPYLDVTLKYNIKTADGRDTGIKESETILVTEQKNFKKEFATQSLGPGDYILELELVYETIPGKFAVATASSHFTVKSLGEVQRSSAFQNYRIIIGILFIGIVLLIILIIFIIRGTKKRKEILIKKHKRR